MREVFPTRSTALALADERRLMRQGFEFLDEKRMLLAGEMLRQSRRWEELAAAWRDESRRAAEALAAAVEVHGLDVLQLLPPAGSPPPVPNRRPVAFLGVPLHEIEMTVAAPEASDPSAASEIAACHTAHRRLHRLAAAMGVTGANILRLIREYRRVERRARALENVLLPEVGATLEHVVEQLDQIDQEEAVRVRSLGRRRRS